MYRVYVATQKMLVGFSMSLLNIQIYLATKKSGTLLKQRS